MKLPLALLFALLGTCCFSQEKFYAYRADWSNTADLKEAKYLKHVAKEDTVYVCRYYNLTGPMIRMESYKDEALTIPMGRFAWYNEKGRIDSTGLVFEGRKDGFWMYITHPDSSNMTITENFDKGKFQWRMDHINKRTTYKDGRVVPFDTSTVKDSSKGFVSVQKEAGFKNGVSAWKKYLERNLKTPDRFINIVKGNGRATIVIGFTVDTEGSVSDVFLWKSVEWSVDTEARRVISNGPKWEPATQNGKKVLYRQKQSITFVVEE